METSLTKRKMAARTLAVVLCFALCAGPAAAENSNPFRMPADIDAAIRKSLDELYALKYEESVRTLEPLASRADAHPMVAFALASALWWRLSVYVLEPDAEESEPFLQAVERSVEVAKNKIREGDPTGEAHMAMGGALGLWGRWEATNRNWLSAYFKGKKAIRYLREAVKINPALKDAYMGLGIFDYYVATLPAVVRVLAFLGSGADKEKGLRELETAAFESEYARIPSKLFLVDIYSNQENNAERALEILATMKEEQPDSPFVHFLEIIALYNCDRPALLQESGRRFLARMQDGTYVDDAETMALFSAGLARFKVRAWKDALRLFDEAIETQRTKQAFFAWSYLFKGYAQAALGDEDGADDAFEKVLDEMRRWNSHDNARAALREPVKEAERQVDKLRL